METSAHGFYNLWITQFHIGTDREINCTLNIEHMKKLTFNKPPHAKLP